ncbi:hypothetical protein QGX12_gp017 [Pseudomonas phage Kremar]|uniref:Uncharacterized protein n=1 Tax=Pseudomonas phage Kremar TaxID=2928831 RepID=A0AAE9KEB5_9CAUD|nr:hypothetical protein QGX12_gp017 [Pseudomonas phage Kremar]UOL48440.1 hypothetical protein [Pseudomonas phage Kremar]
MPCATANSATIYDTCKIVVSQKNFWLATLMKVLKLSTTN